VDQKPPQVTVIIPVYNGECYVRETLHSVLHQTWQDLEIIVVNDGSTDRSMEICRQFDDPRIRYVEQANGGLAAARNSGISNARGEYLGFIDADDIWLPDKIMKHMEQFQADPELGLSYSWSALMDEAGEDLGTLQKEGTNPTTFADCYTRNVIGNGSNAMLRREVFSGRDSDAGSFPALHYFDPELRRAEDYELRSRIASLTDWTMACIPQALVMYRINLSGLSSNTRLQRHYHLLAMAKIAAYEPVLAEQHRCKAVAHLYWHQARTHAHHKNSRPGLRAVLIALYYDWRSLSGNHFMIGTALCASLVLSEAFYYGLFRLAGRSWGWYQRLQVRFSGLKSAGSAATSKETGTLSGMIREPERYARKKAMPNLFFTCHKHKAMFLAIAKNASSSLKLIFYREEFGDAATQAQQNIHKAWGWSARPGRLIERDDTKSLGAHPGYVRFAVYRDPVSRFVSTFHNRVLYSSIEHPFYVGKKLEGMGFDQFINVTESILKIRNPLHVDEHIRPQAWIYQLSDVDYIVPIERLREFLQVEFGIQPEPGQNSTTLPRIKPNLSQTERIRNLYACDYAIKPNWPGEES